VVAGRRKHKPEAHVHMPKGTISTPKRTTIRKSIRTYMIPTTLTASIPKQPNFPTMASGKLGQIPIKHHVFVFS
jgi:hypothetical protein